MRGLSHLTGQFPRPGWVVWIGVRPQKRAPLSPCDAAEIAPAGLLGDHRTRPGKRALSLIQAEHLPVIAALSGHAEVAPETLRRNLVIAGINLLSLRHWRLQIGGAEIRLTGACAPCSRMEAALGPGGYNAMRGHGGMTAEVLRPGPVSRGDPVVALGLEEG